MNLLLSSLGVGIPFFLLSGALLWLLWRRQTGQHQPLQGISHTAQTALWMRSHKIQPLLGASQFTPSAVLGSEAPEVLPMFENTELIPSPQSADIPSDPSSMTTASMQQRLTISLDNTLSSAQSGLLQSQPMDAFNLPLQPTEARASNKNGQTPLLAFAPTAEMETSPLSISSPLAESPNLPRSVCPPAIKDDPMLATMMRQAQVGLFVLLEREKS